MTAAQANRLCKQWQRVLRIQDWDIDVQFVPLGVLPDYVLGECQYFLPKKSATIRMVRSEDVPRDWQTGGADEELVLVHELCHVVLAPAHTDDVANLDSPPSAPRNYNDEVEQAVHNLSRALVALRRGGKAA